MPITLGCPSCGKRFRARDESAGKRVKCPYCAAAVPVPTAEEAAAAGAPTAVLPPNTATPPEHGSAVAPQSWGTSPAAPANPVVAAPPPPAPTKRIEAKPKPAPKPKPAAVERTPEQNVAAAWKKTRAGLCWVLFGLFWLTIPGFVGFGKIVYTRGVGALPQGDGWVSIPGYVNDDAAQNAIRMTKVDQLDVALYALPIVLGGLCLTFGRLTAGAAPRMSGSGGLFAASGLFTLLGLAALIGAAALDKLLFHAEYAYAAIGFLILAAAAEFWFLTGLAASGLSLKRPSVARAVGMVGFFFALAAAIPTLGWMAYTNPQWKLRPSPMNEEWRLYEQAGLMIGWLLLIGVYWRAVRGVRLAISDALSSGTV